jgi:hypothetical protein
VLLRRATVSLLLSLLIAGCTREAESPQPQRERPVAPIAALQVADLLSDKVQDRDGNLFTTVEPDKCSGMAREVDPPLIFDLEPAATDGGHWVTGEDPVVVIDEAAGVYHADFDAKRALDQTRHTIESCRDVPFTVTDMRGREYHFTLLPQSNWVRPTSCSIRSEPPTGRVTTVSSPRTMPPSGSRRVPRSTATTCCRWSGQR